MSSDDLHKQLKENNDRYWRIRNRVKAEQNRLKKLPHKKKKLST